MKNSTKFLTLIALTLTFAYSITSCNKKAEDTTETVAETIFNLTTAKAEIEVANKEFMQFFAIGDSIAVRDSIGLANKEFMQFFAIGDTIAFRDSIGLANRVFMRFFAVGDTIAVGDSIGLANRGFMRFFAVGDTIAVGDSIGLANLYTKDAKFMNTMALAITGKTELSMKL